MARRRLRHADVRRDRVRRARRMRRAQPVRVRRRVGGRRVRSPRVPLRVLRPRRVRRVSRARGGRPRGDTGISALNSAKRRPHGGERHGKDTMGLIDMTPKSCGL